VKKSTPRRNKKKPDSGVQNSLKEKGGKKTNVNIGRVKNPALNWQLKKKQPERRYSPWNDINSRDEMKLGGALQTRRKRQKSLEREGEFLFGKGHGGSKLQSTKGTNGIEKDRGQRDMVCDYAWTRLNRD